MIHRRWAAALALLVALLMAPPVFAHKGEKHGKAQATQLTHGDAQNGIAPASSGVAAPTPPQGMTAGMNEAGDRTAMPFFQRLSEWLGRLHPMIVHFPIAFFPAALFTAIVGRRKSAYSAPVQFLVVAGGLFAPIAATAGWLAGMGADPDPILTWHRWVGVAVGVGGAALGMWAWRRPREDRGAGMILALAVMTIAIAVQGFLGAGITHGIEHLMF